MLLPDQPEGIKRDILNPYEAMRQLFHFAPLPQLKATLWRLLKDTLTGPSAPELAPTEQYHLLTFYEKLENVLEAAHHLSNERTGKEQNSNDLIEGNLVLQNILDKGGSELAHITRSIIALTGAER